MNLCKISSIACPLIISVTIFLSCNNTDLSEQATGSNKILNIQEQELTQIPPVGQSTHQKIPRDTQALPSPNKTNLSGSPNHSPGIETSTQANNQPSKLQTPTPAPLPTPTPAPLPTQNGQFVEFYTGMISNKIPLLAVSQGYNAGKSVSMDNSHILIGTPKDPHSGSTSGSTYVFSESGNSWTQQAKLTPSDGKHADQFGQTVSISGNYAVIGAPLSDSGAADAGAVYVFTAGTK